MFGLRPQDQKTWTTQSRGAIARRRGRVPVHLYGLCADMKAIASRPETRPVVVEDDAQAMTATVPAGRRGVQRARGTASYPEELGTFGTRRRDETRGRAAKVRKLAIMARRPTVTAGLQSRLATARMILGES